MKKKAEKKVKSPSESDVKNLLLHLESEYRKANISEKHYKELKEKYKNILKGFDKKDTGEKIHEEKSEEMKEPTDAVSADETENHLKEVEEKVKREMDEEKTKTTDEKKGFFKSLFGNKKQNIPQEEPEKVDAPEEVEEVVEKPKEKKSVFKLFGKKNEVEKENVKDDAENEVPADPPKKDKKEKEEEITEITPEVIERLAQQAKEQSEGEKEKETENKKGFFKSIIGKKKQNDNIPTSQPLESVSESETQAKDFKTNSNYDVEIEKIKVMLDTVKETGRVTDETVRNISENVGEIRSMVFQSDAEMKENAIKMEKIEDEISEVRPQEINKKFREFNDRFEKNQLTFEMLEKKTSDAGEKINKIFEMLKSIGGIENLMNINKDVQIKLEDMKEVMKYIERIGTKTEKMFVDLNKGLQDLVIIRAQQEDFNESLKDMVKNMDALNVKFEGYVAKKDLDPFREDDVLIKKQMDEIKKVLPVAELKIPENIINLRKEREDIRLLLESLEEHVNRGRISKTEYRNVKDANMKKLDRIRADLEKEWKKIGIKIKPEEKESENVENVKIEEKVEEKKEEKNETENEKGENAEKAIEIPSAEEKDVKRMKKGKRKVEEEPEEAEEEIDEIEEKESEEKNKIEEMKNKMEDIKETFEKKESVFNEEVEEKKAETTKVEEKEEPTEEKIEKPKEVVKKPKKEVKISKKTKPHKIKNIKKATKKRTKAKKPVKIKRKVSISTEEKRKTEILKGLKKLH